ncbi:hypothetical protein BHM03_00022228 [Ensete ventricosum]|nr:hypothetical protein BHM03_00022228 [Ensete ventricosum]
MLQRAYQYMVIETLVAGKRDESKRPRVEQPRGHPPEPPKRREVRYTPKDATKGGIVTFTRSTTTTRKNDVTYSIKSKTSSDTGTYVSMFATNLYFPLADLLEIHRPDPRVRSKSKSTSSSGGQPRATTTPRRTRLMPALRLERPRHHIQVAKRGVPLP